MKKYMRTVCPDDLMRENAIVVYGVNKTDQWISVSITAPSMEYHGLVLKTIPFVVDDERFPIRTCTGILWDSPVAARFFHRAITAAEEDAACIIYYDSLSELGAEAGEDPDTRKIFAEIMFTFSMANRHMLRRFTPESNSIPAGAGQE